MLAGLSRGFAIALLFAGCASTRPQGSPHPVLLREPTAIAVVPFEDLSGHADVGDQFTKVFHAELARSAIAPVLDPGVVEDVIERLQIRSTSAMTATEMKMLADTLQAGYLLFGNVLESGAVHTADGDLPALAVTLRLVEADSAKVVWACHHSRTGEDNETVFGWGRERSRERLLGKLAYEAIDELRQSVKRTDKARRNPR